jgi:hypothetical protein
MMAMMTVVLRGRGYDGDIEGNLQRGETKQKNCSTNSYRAEDYVLLKARNL